MSRRLQGWILGGCVVIAALEAPAIGALLRAGPDAPSSTVDVSAELAAKSRAATPATREASTALSRQVTTAGLAFAPGATPPGF